MTTPIEAPPWVKTPQQKRSREKFQLMIKAAERLFAEQGVHETTVQQIVSEAGVSVGAFYQRFENKESLIHTIFHLLEDELFPSEEDLKAEKDDTLIHTMEKFVYPMIKVFKSRRGVLLAIILDVQRDPSIRRYAAKLRDRSDLVLSKALRQHKDEIGHRNFKVAVAMTCRMVNAYLDQYLIWAGHPETEKKLKFSTSEKELVRMLTDYLKHG